MKNVFALLLLSSFSSFGQVDFNNYVPLQSNGSIPDDFTKNTYEKLEEDRKQKHDNLSSFEEKKFYEGINYAVDDLMHSGYVSYGDPITEYVTAIADKLLAKDKELKDKLRFYTLKTDVVNAFSTEQGIVFVTTGMISQLANEAQLALILAHEISHYNEHHVLESFIYKNDHKMRSLENLSIYSKEKELDADKLGLDMYVNAGYSLEEVIPTFDVLLYSYLPFDELDIKVDYFKGADSLYYPKSLFPSEVYEITASENEDDNRSSHPNIHKRKEAMALAMENTNPKGNDVYKLGKDKFIEIRDIARFEALRSQVFEAEYGKALYSIFLLEQKYPESQYLRKMKAQAWYGILQYNIEKDLEDVIVDESKWEGSSASVHYMLKNTTFDELNTICIRQITDLKNENPEDQEMKAIYDLMIKRLVYSEKFDINDYAVFGFNTAREKFNAQNDTGEEEEVEEEQTTSNKYDRIKKKRDVNEVVHFDSTTFHKYLIPDLVVNDEFLAALDKYKKEIEEEEEKDKEYDALTNSEKRKFNKQREENKYRLGISNIIAVEPLVFEINKRGVDRVKSEKLSDNLSDILHDTAEKTDVTIQTISSNDLSTKGTEAFNERALLMNYLEQTARHKNIESFPVDYSLLNDLEEKYGTSKIQFTWFTHQYNPEIGFEAVLAIIAYPYAPIYFPYKFFSGNKSTISIAILDTSTGNLDAFIDYSYNAGVRKYVIGAHLYTIYSTIKSEKK